MIEIHPDTRALIFDCDGTLADTMPLHWQAWYETFDAFGISCPHDVLEQLKGAPTEDIIEYINKSFGYHVDIALFTKEKEKRSREKLKDTKPIIPVVNLAIKFKGKFPMAVASGGKRINVDLTLETIGLQDHFDAILTADDKIKPKPAPDLFLEAAKRLNTEPRFCQVFEDSDLGIEAAKKANMFATDVRIYLND